MVNMRLVLVFLCLIFVCSLSTAFATDDSKYIAPINQSVNIKEHVSFYVQEFNTTDIWTSDIFQEWIKKNIGSNDCSFTLENPNIASNNKTIIKIYTQTEKMYLSVKPKNQKTNSVLLNSLGTSTLKFMIYNGLSSTVNRVSIVLYKDVPFIKFPIPVAWSDRYNLAPGRQLNYNPDPGTSYVTIGIKTTSKNGIILRPFIPLGDWHKAIIKKEKGYYLDFV